MDDELREAGLWGCVGCLGIIVTILLSMAAFTYACVVVIDAIKS